jgi:hypothetical protein
MSSCTGGSGAAPSRPTSDLERESRPCPPAWACRRPASVVISSEATDAAPKPGHVFRDVVAAVGVMVMAAALLQWSQHALGPSSTVASAAHQAAGADPIGGSGLPCPDHLRGGSRSPSMPGMPFRLAVAAVAWAPSALKFFIATFLAPGRPRLNRLRIGGRPTGAHGSHHRSKEDARAY